MAKTKKTKKLNTKLDDDFSADMAAAPQEDVVPAEVEAGEGDEMGNYTMGIIETDDSEENEKEEFEKAAKTVTSPDTDEEDVEWVEDEEYNNKDEDAFLDEEAWDPDDPEEIY